MEILWTLRAHPPDRSESDNGYRLLSITRFVRGAALAAAERHCGDKRERMRIG